MLETTWALPGEARGVQGPAAALVVDAIPKNANGKIERHALAALWEARTAR